MWMYPIAVACGNSLFKTFRKDPSCPVMLADFSLKQVYEWVFNVINGDKRIVDSIISCRDISSVSFVGSTPVTKYIYEQSAKNHKNCKLSEGQKITSL